MMYVNLNDITEHNSTVELLEKFRGYTFGVKKTFQEASLLRL